MQTIIPGNTGAIPENKASASAIETSRPREAVGLETAIDNALLNQESFVDAVRQAAEKLGCEFLFDLPASGLTENCSQIAVLRHVRVGRDDLLLIVKLNTDDETVTVSEPDEAMQGLAVFARAFVNLLSRL